MSFTRAASFAASLAAVSLMGFGCNPFESAQEKISQKIGESVAEGIVGKATDGKVNLDADKGQMVFKDTKTGDMMAFGENVTLPPEFPKDIPMYAGVKVVGLTISAKAGTGTSVTMKSESTKEKIVTWYAGQMKSAGFTEESSMTAGNTDIRSYSKGSVKITLTVAFNSGETPESIITLIRTEKTVNE